MPKTINIIGAGHCGKVIARLISDTKCAQIQCILNTTFASGQKAREFIGSGEVCTEIKQLKPADIYLITTPDSSIENVCGLLARKHSFKNNSIILHCSGALSADILYKAKKSNCLIASMHPIKSFADPQKSIKTFAGTFCAYDGEKEAFATIAAIFKAIGGQIFTIDSNKKPLYHAAAVFCCNYLITLSHIANKCYEEVGISKETARQIVQNLMQDTLENLNLLPHEQALSGPIARGDIDTLEKHKAALENSPTLKLLYAELGKQTILLTNHDDKLKQQLKNLLDKK